MELAEAIRHVGIIGLAIAIFITTISATQAQIYLPSNDVWNGGPITPSWSTSNTTYDYEVTGTPYTARLLTDPTAGNSIQYTTPLGGEMFLQPQGLNWVNDIDQLEQISFVQSITGSPNGTTFTYPEAYGTGIDLRYVANELQLREELVIKQAINLPTPPAYMDGTTRYLQLNFNFNTNAKIMVDGAEWDQKTTTETNESITIRDSTTNEPLYTLPAPYAIDANGDTVIGKYKIKKQGSSLYIGKEIPYSWLQTAVYPVIVDPTFEIDYSPIPGELLVDGQTSNFSDSEFATVTDVTTTVSDNNIGTTVNVERKARTITGYDAYESVGGTNINTQTATSGDGNFFLETQIGSAGSAIQIITDQPLQDSSILRLRLRPNVNSANQELIITDKSSLQTHGSFTLGTSGVWQTHDIELNSIPAAGINEFHIYNPNGQGNWRVDVDYIEALRTNTSNPTKEYVATTNTATITSDLLTRGGGFVNDLQMSSTTESLRITTTENIVNGDRLEIDLTPATNNAEAQTIQVRNAAGTQTYATITTALNDGIYETYSPELSGLPEGGVSELRLYVPGGSSAVQYDIDYVSVQKPRNYYGGTAISGHWTQTYDSQWNYWLRVYKNTSGIHDATIIAYSDSDNLSNQSVNATLAGSGWFNINISSLMEWQLANTDLNSTDLRYYTEETSSLSELLLRQEGNDSTPPVIGTCTTNDSTIYDGESTTITCPVSDNLDVDTVTGTLGSSNIMFSQVGTTGNYNYEYTCNAVGEDQIETLNLVNATDIVGLTSTQNPGVNINCKRHCDYKGSGPWNIIKNFACETSEAFSDFGNEWRINNANTTNITNNVSNFSNMNVTGNSTITITGGTTVTIGT